MKNYCVLLFIFFLPVSCDHKKGSENRIPTVSFSVSNVLEKIKLSEIASKVNYVPLETNDSILISNITKIVHKDNFMYVTDGLALYKFDAGGKFISN